MGVAGGSTIWDDRDRLVGRMRRIVPDLDVHHRGQTAKPLRADAESIDLVIKLEA